MKTFLHVGCGQKRQSQTTLGFGDVTRWKELRLDIDPQVQPDVEGTMLDMSLVPTGSVDAVYSSHNIEHVYPHEVMVAMSEFLRVLAENGFLVITCPDLQSVSALIADDELTEPAYDYPAGPIAAIDILYGFRKSIERGNHFMAHKCGFTRKVLHGTLQAAGFKSIGSLARGHPFYDLWAVAAKDDRTDDEMRVLASQHLPR